MLLLLKETHFSIFLWLLAGNFPWSDALLMHWLCEMWSFITLLIELSLFLSGVAFRWSFMILLHNIQPHPLLFDPGGSFMEHISSTFRMRYSIFRLGMLHYTMILTNQLLRQLQYTYYYIVYTAQCPWSFPFSFPSSLCQSKRQLCDLTLVTTHRKMKCNC